MDRATSGRPLDAGELSQRDNFHLGRGVMNPTGARGPRTAGLATSCAYSLTLGVSDYDYSATRFRWQRNPHCLLLPFGSVRVAVVSATCDDARPAWWARRRLARLRLRFWFLVVVFHDTREAA